MMKAKIKPFRQVTVIFSLILASVGILGVTHAIAQSTVYPRSAMETGEIIENFIQNSSGGRLDPDEVKIIEASGQPYTWFWYIRLSNGMLYRVCQTFQYGRPISQPYWCP